VTVCECVEEMSVVITWTTNRLHITGNYGTYVFFKYRNVSITMSDVHVLGIVGNLVSQKRSDRRIMGCINSRLPSNARRFVNSFSNNASCFAGQAPITNKGVDSRRAAFNICVFVRIRLVGCYFPGKRHNVGHLHCEKTKQLMRFT